MFSSRHGCAHSQGFAKPRAFQLPPFPPPVIQSTILLRIPHQQVKLNTNALPLTLLLVHPGGGAEARGFVARALELWLRERMRARLTYAMARYFESKVFPSLNTLPDSTPA